jgi:integrase
LPPLTDTEIRAAKAPEKPVKLFDGGGLFLLVQPNGSRLWRLKYRIDGREKLLALGAYPEVGLKDARIRREQARSQLADGVDPGAARKAQKVAQANTFEAIAREWLEKQRNKFTASTFAKAEWMLEEFLFPHIGARPIESIDAPDILAALRKVEARGRIETAHRTKWRAGEIFRYAIATGRARRNPAGDLRGALIPVRSKRRAAITNPAKIGELLRALDGYSGQLGTEIALKLAPHVFVRPGELRGARWEEFTLEGKEPTWRIPGERMKMGEEHIVPLSSQAVALLEELRPVTGPQGLLFPSLLTAARPMSENTINAALRRLGYSKDDMTGHGFRAMASTCLNELGHPPDVIELQLAHAERNKVRAAYNRAQRLGDRRKMMQSWSDYLDELRAGGSVTRLRRAER